MKRSYHTIDKQEKVSQRKLVEFLARNGQVIDLMRRASVEAVLELSARQVAGEPQRGKARTGEVGWHGTQPGRVNLKKRKLRPS